MSTIIIKNSQTPGASPGTLAPGELAINTVDGKIFYGSGGGVTQFSPPVDTSSLASTGSNTFRGNQTITGSEFVSGNVVVAQSVTASSAKFTSASIDYLYVNSFESASTIYSSGSNQFGDAPNDIQTLYGSVIIPTGSLTVTGSVNITGSTTQTGNNTLTGNTTLSGSIRISGSSVIQGTTTMTGSLSITGSTTQIGNNNLYGNTTLSGSIIISGSVNALANITMGGTLRLDPATDPGNPNATASFLFTSASNTETGFDLYYRQNDNLVKFKWIEGGISSGLLYGGIISASGATIYVSSGSGIIMDPNATPNKEINPTYTYVTWNNYSASAQYLTSSQNTYLYVDSFGVIHQQTNFFDQTQYEQAIPLGRATHPNYSSITGVGSNVQTTYDGDSQQSAFIRAFGPLKINGFSINAQTNSLRFGVGSGVAYTLGGFYSQDPNSPSHYHGNAFATASIARAYRSGSGFRLDNNGGAFYTIVDPDYWDDGTGILNTMAAGDWQIQRAFFNPITGRTVVYYGQNTYTTLINALQYLSTDSFEEGEFTANSLVFIGYLVLKGQTNNLTDTNNNRIINAGIFRNIAGSSAGGGVVSFSLDNLSDVTINSPSNGQALIYNSGEWVNGTPVTASYVSGSVFTSTNPALSASFALTSSFALTASFATTSSFATTASYAMNAGASINTSSFATTGSNTFSGSQIITGSLAIGTLSLGPNENTLTLGARDTSNEGGQLGFNAPGGTNTSASFLENSSNKFKLLRGTNASSTDEIATWDLGTRQMQLPAYTSATSFTGTSVAGLAVDSSGNILTQTFVDSGQQTYTGQITFSAATGSGVTNHTYNYTQVGKMVSLRINLWWTVAGSSGNTLQLALPAGTFPQPSVPPGFTANSDFLYGGTGYMAAASTIPGANYRVGIRTTSGGGSYEIAILGGAVTLKAAWAQVTYWTS
jgi:hypothetical protein